MAFDGPGFDFTLPANADLSTEQYHLVDFTTDGKLRVATARGQRCHGVVQDKSTASGNASKFRFGGMSKVAAGDSSAMDNAIVFGTPLISSSVGQAVPTTDGLGDFIIGFAFGNLSTGSTGIIPAMLTLAGQSSS